MTWRAAQLEEWLYKIANIGSKSWCGIVCYKIGMIAINKRIEKLSSKNRLQKATLRLDNIYIGDYRRGISLLCRKCQGIYTLSINKCFHY